MAGDITVAVQVQNIPDGTPVRLRVTMVGGVDIRLVTSATHSRHFHTRSWSV